MTIGDWRLGIGELLSHRHRYFQSSIAFSLVEVLVVMAISLLLMTTGTFIYLNCLKIYRESQEVTEVMQTARLVERDLRDALGNVVPLRGAWLTPVAHLFPGQPDAFQNGWNPATNTNICVYYTADLRWGTYARGAYNHQTTIPLGSNPTGLAADQFFSGVQADEAQGGGLAYSLSAYRNGPPSAWYSMADQLELGGNCFYIDLKDYWLPAFYGWRDGTAACDSTATDSTAQYTNVIQRFDNFVGAWGWPRPDYRLNADADLLAANTATLNNGANVACWFYTEDRYCDNVATVALDNNNILLASLKFTRRNVNGAEQTQLSLLTHHAFGVDHPYMGQSGQVRCDVASGNLLRAVSITPCYLDAAGNLQPMTDNQLGCTLAGATLDDGGVSLGMALPRCFDVRYRLRGPVSGKTWTFALRIYCRSNSQ